MGVVAVCADGDWFMSAVEGEEEGVGECVATTGLGMLSSSATNAAGILAERDYPS